MAEWPRNQDYNRITIASSSPEACGQEIACTNVAPASSPWYLGNANVAIYIPFVVFQPFTAVKMGAVNGAAVAGNVDVGIYDDQGNRLVSIGSTVQAGTSAIQSFDITDTTLRPGVYFMAQVHDSASATVNQWPVSASSISAFGIYAQGTAFPLPASATFAVGGLVGIPDMFVTGRTLI